MLGPDFSSVQHIGLPTTNYSAALGNEFLGVPWEPCYAHER
jgi:hypothetical protein